MKSKYTKLVAVLMCVLVATVYSVPVFALETTANDEVTETQETEQNSDSSVVDEGTDGNISWSVDSDGVLVIAGTGSMNNYRYYYDSSDKKFYTTTPWDDYLSSIKQIKIESGVTSIGDCAFYESSVQNVSFADSVTSIGIDSFCGCASLEEINFPKNLTKIDSAAFEQCTGLKELTIPGTITSMASYTDIFRGCSSLTKVTISEGVDCIPSRTFKDCSSLKQVTIPESVNAIGLNAFSSCTSLEEITIPSNVKSIGTSAFAYCSSLKEIVIPDHVGTIGASTFSACTALNEITIPDNVTLIAKDAFSDCTNLSTIVCNPGSTAHTFAENNNYKTICITHDWETTATRDKEPTCTTAGSQSIHCKNCTETKDVTPINPLGHTLDDGVVTTEPTCTDKGVKTFICSVCHEEVTEEIPANGHTFTHKKVSAGLLKNGTEYDLCTVCGAKANEKKLTGYAAYVVKSFKVSKGKKSFTAKWKKASKANQKKMDGYQVRYSKKSNMSGAKYVKASKTSKSKKVSKLSKKKTYYVQVRTYKKSKGVTYYSKWSSKKKIKTK